MQKFNVGDTIRMPHYPTVGDGAYRVWKVIGCYLGALNQEGTYALSTLEIMENEAIHVPCIMLESHPLIERM